MIKPMVVPLPEYQEPKKGGLVDAVRHGRFIEYLCDVDWEEKRDEQIENEVNDCLMSPDCGCEDCKRENVWMDR